MHSARASAAAMLVHLPPVAASPWRRHAARRSRAATAPRAVAVPPHLPSPPPPSDAPPLAWRDDVLFYERPRALPRVSAPRGASPLVILPGFGNDSADYTAPFGEASASLVAALASRGFEAHVVPVVRKDWFSVARALLSPRFYLGSCTTDEGARLRLRWRQASVRVPARLLAR